MNRKNVSRPLAHWLVPLLVVGFPRYALIHSALLVLAKVCMVVKSGVFWEPMPAPLFFFCAAAALASVSMEEGMPGTRWSVAVLGVLGVLFLAL